jgi:hypothetical protein
LLSLDLTVLVAVVELDGVYGRMVLILRAEADMLHEMPLYRDLLSGRFNDTIREGKVKQERDTMFRKRSSEVASRMPGERRNKPQTQALKGFVDGRKEPLSRDVSNSGSTFWIFRTPDTGRRRKAIMSNRYPVVKGHVRSQIHFHYNKLYPYGPSFPHIHTWSLAEYITE